MKYNLKLIVIFIVIIVFSAILRFYQIGSIPPGLTIDESSQGYNAFSLLNTGKDRYGQPFPILFRLFDSIQVPLYTYLTIAPIYFFGNSIFSIRFISALSGVILIGITFLLFINFEKNRKNNSLAIISALMVAISPWAVFYSRICTEASLGVTLFILSIMFFYFSLRHRRLFPIATFILGLSTHAYYSERIISILFLIGFIWLFRKTIFLQRRIFILGIVLFIITQIPHLWVANSGAFTRRIIQVNYFSEQFFQENSGNLRNIPLGRLLFIVREFVSQYLAYFSPKNLFFDPDPQQGVRSMPDLSVFYSWVIIPFLFGLRSLILNRSLSFVKILILLLVIGPFAASLTRDPFATIRVLGFLWGITITIAFGLNYLLGIFSSFKLKLLTFTVVVLLSLIQLYLAYFVLLKYERSHNYGYSYVELLKQIELMRDKHFVVDSSREPAAGIMFAFFKKYDPNKLQKDLGPLVVGRYYSSFDPNEIYIVDNIEARPIFWKEDACKKQILVGDLLAISDNQVKEHKLSFLFDIKDTAGDVVLKAYETDPDIKCNLNTKILVE
ncbi:MAG: glycosyltransferase family 39 protein [Candidatus Daviesbacteria bacterium]|nr:glycosyltransferase family 39 protein [Candidatus Daviesbacteria bacterium]